MIVLFWRAANGTVARHRNPIVSAMGVGMKTMVIDRLHVLHLGVYNSCCMTVLWSLILADAWGVGTTKQETLIDMSVELSLIHI